MTVHATGVAPLFSNDVNPIREITLNWDPNFPISQVTAILYTGEENPIQMLYGAVINLSDTCTDTCNGALPTRACLRIEAALLTRQYRIRFHGYDEARIKIASLDVSADSFTSNGQEMA